MPEAHTEEEAIRLEWEKTKFTYQRLAESLIDAAKLFATKPVEGASEAEVAKALEKAAKIQAEQQRWENYLGFDKTKKPEPACFNFEKKKDYDERLGTFEARAQSGEEVKLEEVKGLLDELPLGVIWERARVLEESPSLKEYFAGRQLPEDLSEEEKEFFKKYQEFARRPYEEIIRELKQAPEITPKKEAEPTLIYVADEERNKEGAVIYLKEPKKVDNQEITQVTLKPPAITGPESARVFVSAPFKGTKKENEEYTGMGPGTAFDWEKVTSLQFTEKDGNKIRISKEDLSLEPPKKVEEEVAVKEKEKPVFIKVAFPERAKEGTVVYIVKNPPEVDGQEITKVTLKPPAVKGPESAALFVKAPYKGSYGEEFTGMNPGTIFNWENVSSLQFVDSEGNKIRVSKENLSLKPPEEKVEKVLPYGEAPYEEEYKEELEERIKPPETKEEKSYEEVPYGEEYAPEYEEVPSKAVKKPEMVITGINPFEAAARDLARKWMEADKKELRVLRGLPARVIKHNWFREYHLEKKRQQALELMEKAGTPFAEKIIDQAREQGAQEIKQKGGVRNLWQRTLGREKAIHKRSLEIIEDWQESGRLKDFEEMITHEQSLENTIKRFTQEHDKTIHEAAGEEVKLLDESDEKQKEIANNIRSFITRYITGHFDGTLDEGALIEELNQYLATRVSQEHLGQAQLYATSLKETAGIVIAQLEHLQGTEDLQKELEETVAKIPIKMGKAVWGVRSGETEKTRTEKTVRRIRETWVGGLVNEASLATAVSLALSFSTRVTPSLTRRAASMALPVVGGALVGGGFHAFQENMRLKEERITHLRESAQGLEFSPEAKRRAWMEQFVYDSREANEAVQTLEDLSAGELNEANVRVLFAQLADLRARILLSDTEKIDLISFSAPTQVEIERTNLDLTLSQAEANLRKYLEGKTEFKQTILQEQDFDSYLGSLTELASHAHLEGARTNIAELQRLVPEEKKTVRALDKEFAKKRRIRAVTEGAKAAAIGAAIGEITWELSHFRDLTSEHPQVITPLSWALRKIGAVKEAAPTIKEEVREVAREVVRTTTENLRLRLGPDGLYDLVDKAGHPIPGAENLQTNLDGSLTKKSLEMLKDYGAVLRQETLVDPTAPLVSQGGIRLSQGLRLIDPDGDGKYNLIVEKTGKIFKGLKDLEIDPKTGEISAEMEETLQKASLNVARQTRRFVAGHEDIPVTRTLRNWLVRHTDKVQRIFRDRWYDNDTKMWFNPETGKMEGADFNEIRLLWGDGGDGLTEAGDFALDASYMTPDGSWHDGFSANAQALLAEGKLKLLISLGKDAQNRVLVIPFNRAGKAIIKRASEEARLAFGVRNARAILKGYAAEVAHVTREEGGVQHVGILATHLGENSVSEVVEKISRPIYGQTLTSTITSPGKLFHVTGEAVREITEKVTKKVPEKITTKLIEWVYQGPPVIPIIPRRPLEKAEEAAPPVPPYPEYPEYEEYYPEYPEYGAEVYEEYPPEEYEAYMPYYEKIYEALKVPEEERKELRKKTPLERLKEVTEKAKVTLEEKPYPEQIEELAAQLGIKLEEEKKPEKPLDLKKEVEATMKFPEHSKEQTRKIFFTPDPLAGGDGHLIWQGVCYGKPSKKPDRELFRGYLQVDPTDIPLAIEIMHELAKKRIEDNKSTELKWLIGTRDPESDTRKYEDYIGNYTRLEEAEPRAAIYTETDEEILEIVRALAQDPHWKAIEEKRKASPRRPGVNAFRDSMGQEWRSLNYNEKPGYSEDEAEDPDWRERKEGTPTIFLETKEKRGIEKVSQVIDEVVQRPELRNRAKQLAGEEFSREVFEDVAPDIINTMFEQTIRATFTPESGFDMPRAEEPEGNEEFKTLIPQVQSMILQIVKQDASESGEEYQQRVQNYTHAVCHLLAVEKGVNKDWLKLEEAARFKYLQAILTSYDILKETLKS